MQPTYPSIPADGTVKIYVPECYAPTVHDTEAPPTQESFRFTDSEGDTFTVTMGLYGDDDILTLSVQDTDSEVIFFKADALKIIALIAEAAK